ncbi:hypothetical protein MOK15_07005 [Sphingobium sp. BYY-5]|uniref:hypothetical protein n=1 Tax=Sphingobium sp. BYY-5 TaxID=2926400 RepID=UPI001FA6DAFB|nr:hypothetical protein [Sphingobium sp. BYY-5]MCI4589837.1 hypothetical protein [Sphingobium sp. BYY-5]
MATVVLTAVGTVLGGPIGGAIGGLIGNVIDNQVLFKPKGREGARLADLQLQTSSYGTQVPKIFGTMRVAGTVIWATDLRETKSRSGGGKGRGSVTSYSYSASFAVALSARAIRRIRRIWADGNLLRGAAGDFKTEVTGFRVYLGGEDQAADPLIASAEGIGLTPAHRGVAYVVFEDRLVEPLALSGGEGEPGGVLRLSAIGIGDVEPAVAMLEVASEALMPPSPVHLTARRDGAGGWAIGWTRRSRNGWRWLSGGDVPLGEESERYVVQVMDGAHVVRRAETVAPGWTYAGPMMAADGMAGRTLTVEVRQVGTYATGRPGRIVIESV